MSADPAQVIRADIRAMVAYPVQHATGMIKLDAMENPYRLPQWLREEIASVIQCAEINRYPDPDAPQLKNSLREIMKVPDCCELILGNGSDEIIAMLINAVAGPDTVIMAIAPTFVMFKVSAVIARAKYVGVSVEEDFSLSADKVIAAMREHRPAILFIAYPNNPTGNLFDEQVIRRIIEHAPGLVVIDEAYHVFAKRSFMARLPEFPNMVVMRTLSKLGLAGLRLGYAAARPEWIREIDKVRGPYNVGVLTQRVTERILAHHQVLEDQAREIVVERDRLENALHSMRGITAFPSSANFILLRVPDAYKVHMGLKDRGVLVRSLHGAHPLLEHCVRFTVGTREENDLLLNAFGEILATLG
ncbi:MAG: histidinol-phosphate transaminase [Betaproteobacteria bacterium RIFCSPLOWO2_02_FULL_62_17]|nr:MAG: histidinol-phosphate transaminase [Betaproteobacteria bacterium RIFCSPLOWO2_02_FULL_62_17]